MNSDHKKAVRPRRKKGAGMGSRSIATADKRHVIIHKMQDAQDGFVKFKWDNEINDFVGSQISIGEGKRLLARQFAAFCKPSDVAGKKIYCYFDAGLNQPVCILVDDNDPRCP